MVWNDATLNSPNSNVLFIKRSTDGDKTFGSSIQIIKIIPLSAGVLNRILSVSILSPYHISIRRGSNPLVEY